MISAIAFVVGGVFLIRGALGDASIQGWTSLIVLVSFLSGVMIMMLSMLGEYVLRTLKQVTEVDPYHVVEDLGAAP
jgi:hypothetical protein